jgi:hypothetical protein
MDILGLLQEVRKFKEQRDAEDAKRNEDNLQKILGAGYSADDYKMMQAFVAWSKDIGEVQYFLQLMCDEWDHLPSAKLLIDVTEYMQHAAFFLRERIVAAKISDPLFELNSSEHTNLVFSTLTQSAKRVIEKHANLKEFTKGH